MSYWLNNFHIFREHIEKFNLEDNKVSENELLCDIK